MRRRAVALGYGLMCHGLFAAAVLAMVANLYFGLQLDWMGWDIQRPWLVNIALVLQFPLLHSLFLTKAGTRALRWVAPGARDGTLDTTLFATLSAVQVGVLFACWVPLGAPVTHAQGPLGWVLSAGFVLGWVLLGLSMREAGLGTQTGATGWTALFRGDRPRYAKGFAQAGLHGLCRHPIYASFVLILWTGPVWSLDRLILALPLTAYCVVGPRLKEARYRARHGAAYVRYSARLPSLIPGLIQHRPKRTATR
jgi:protein-S-isoprenylcysteine O-methyltransferase Ste14